MASMRSVFADHRSENIFLILAQILRPVTGSVRCHLLGIKRVVVSTEATSDNGSCRDLPLAAYGQESAVKARFS